MSRHAIVCELTGEPIAGVFKLDGGVCRCRQSSKGPDYCLLREEAALKRIEHARPRWREGMSASQGSETEIQRLVREIAERQARLSELVLGDQRKAVTLTSHSMERGALDGEKG